MPTATPVLPADVAQPTGFLHALLSISLTAVAVLHPLYAEDSATIHDFAWAYLNEAGQRLLDQPARPTASLRVLFPDAGAEGLFAVCCRALAAGEAPRHQASYRAEGPAGTLLVAAQPYENLLVVNFTDLSDQPRAAVELALRESQAREQEQTRQLREAQAAVERERTLLQAMFAQAPVAIALFQGPEVRIASANERMAALWGRTPAQVVGRPLLQALPELQGQGYDDLIRQVQATRVPYVGSEAPATIQQGGQLVVRYYTFSCQPIYDAQGELLGIINVGTEVTEQVETRQQLEQLNQGLEARVQQRTRQLSEQQALLGQILGQVPAAIATLSGPKHRFTFFNEQYQQLNNQRTVLGAPLAEVVPEAAEQGFSALLDEVYRTGQPYVGTEVPVWLQQAGGAAASYYVDFRYQPLHDEQGRVQGVLIFAVDVTKQVLARQQADGLQAELLAAAQHQAAEREAFYQVFEQTTAVVALLRGPQHRYEYVNPTYQAFFPGRQLVGLGLAEAVPELVAQGFGQLLNQVYQTGETFFGTELPFTPPAPAGQAPRPRYFNFTYQAYREAGQVVGTSIVAFDVTEQVLVRQQQQAQAQRLRHVFAQAPVAIFVLRGTEYVFDVVNASMGQLLNMDPDYMLGKGYFELLPALEAQGYRQLLDQVWHSGQEYVAQEQAARLPHHGEGETGYYNSVYVPLYEAEGHATGILCVAVDVTAQVLTRQQVQVLNDELRVSNRQLMRTNVDLDTFVYTASHDLKAPISNIEGLLNALRHQLPEAVQQDETTSQLLRLMQGAVERFRSTIDQLTDVSRLQQAQNLPTEQVLLAPLVEDVRLDLAPQLAQAGAELTVDIAPALEVQFAPKNLRSVVYNLLSNAVKYRHPGRVPRVVLRAAHAGECVELTVQDNGLGLNEQQQQRLFGLFQRLHAHVEGTGVGLYMVKRIIENAGGSIQVRSQEGVGTTFTVQLCR